MKRQTIIATLLALTTLLLMGSGARADRENELQARFKQRYGQVKQLKRAGQIGETTAGMVEAVKGGLDEAAQKLVSEENADRSELYELIAKKEGTTAATVAERNALRNFQRAEAGEYLKGKDGQWRKKS